jgi:plasmid maintenance system antidote protein VapI
VTRQALNNVVNFKAGISPEMAIRLSQAFGSSPEVWLGMQAAYDLAQLEKKAGKIKVRRIGAAEHIRQITETHDRRVIRG